MIPYSAPLDDILASLRAAGAESLPEWDGDLMRQIGEAFAAYAENEVAPYAAEWDAEGAVLEGGKVLMPPSFITAYQTFVEQGWPGLSAPESAGGQGMGAIATAIVAEMLAGADISFQMVIGLVPGAIRVLTHFGTPEQQAAWIPELASGQRIGTMALTEPGAGSDLSRIRTRAEETPEGWRITGEKIFISGGNQNATDGIFHLVLARTGSPESGVKGLSLFACLSEEVEGRLTVTRIEEKMGLKVSPTCQLAFDAAPAHLIGTVGGGLNGMFAMMNHARIDVAMQGIATSARATAIAKAYAAERVQGRKADGSAAVLADHPDVARMLDEMEARTHLCRALSHVALVALERNETDPLVDALTPVQKYAATESGSRVADLGIQVLGGYGYLKEYGLEKLARDVRITRIYEGASGIHALTLAGRGASGAQGAALAAFLAAEVPDVAALWEEGRAALTNPAAQAQDFMALTEWAMFQALAPRLADRPAVARFLAREKPMGAVHLARLKA